MEPVVNGLTEDFKAEVEFRWIDAKSVDGQKIFRAYNLLGHPSYVILNPDGEVLWNGLGELPQENIEEKILIALGE